MQHQSPPDSVSTYTLTYASSRLRDGLAVTNDAHDDLCVCFAEQAQAPNPVQEGYKADLVRAIGNLCHR